jgi:hypothetical protein
LDENAAALPVSEFDPVADNAGNFEMKDSH